MSDNSPPITLTAQQEAALAAIPDEATRAAMHISMQISVGLAQEYRESQAKQAAMFEILRTMQEKLNPPPPPDTVPYGAPPASTLPTSLAAELYTASAAGSSADYDPNRSDVHNLAKALTKLSAQTTPMAKLDPPDYFDGRKPGLLHNFHRDIEIWMSASRNSLLDPFLPYDEKSRRLFAVATRLKGEAKQWFADNMDSLLQGTWHDFKTKQIAHYGLVAGSETAANAMIINSRKRYTDFEEHSQTFKQLRNRRKQANPNLVVDVELERCLYLSTLPLPLVQYVNTYPAVNNVQPTADELDTYLRNMLVRNSYLASTVGFSYSQGEATPMDIGVATSRSRQATVTNTTATAAPAVTDAVTEHHYHYYNDQPECYQEQFGDSYEPDFDYAGEADTAFAHPVTSRGRGRGRGGRPPTRSQYSQSRSGSLAFPRPNSSYQGRGMAPRGGRAYNSYAAPRYGSFQAPQFKGNCRHCNVYGHKAAHCPQLVRNRAPTARVNATAADEYEIDDTPDGYVDPEAVAGYLESYTDDQHFHQDPGSK